MEEHDGVVSIAKSFDSWRGGHIKLFKLIKQKLKDMPEEDVVKEGGNPGERKVDFLRRNIKYFGTRNDQNELEINLDTVFWVLDFQFIGKECGWQVG